jgi:hypothetical protein
MLVWYGSLAIAEDLVGPDPGVVRDSVGERFDPRVERAC